jgi:hypothetical protein
MWPIIGATLVLGRREAACEAASWLDDDGAAAAAAAVVVVVEVPAAGEAAIEWAGAGTGTAGVVGCLIMMIGICTDLMA